MFSEWPYVEGYEPFRKLGTDTFLAISAGSCSFWTCDPDVISQITPRRMDFPKPLELYRVLDIYGINVVTTEGMQWRQHRKVVAPAFNEKSNELAWEESLRVAQEMLRGWLGEGTVHDIASDTMNLALHVISWAGFGERLRWSALSKRLPDISKGLSHQGRISERQTESKYDDMPPGHALTYQDALQSLLANILWVMLIPRVLLSMQQFNMSHMRF